MSRRNWLMHPGAFSWAACRTITLTSPSGCREVPTPQKEKKKKSTKRRKDTSDPPPTSPLPLLIIAHINCRQKAFHQDPAPSWWIGNRGINELRDRSVSVTTFKVFVFCDESERRKKKGSLKVTEHIYTFWRSAKQPGLVSLAVDCEINSLSLLLVSKHIRHVFNPDRLQLLGAKPDCKQAGQDKSRLLILTTI